MSRLPNAELAYVPLEKLVNYALSKEHPVGKHKAMIFEAVLGITVNDAEFLRSLILEAVLVNDATLTRSDRFGSRFQMEFDVESYGRVARVVTAWIIETDEISPRMTTCYIK